MRQDVSFFDQNHTGELLNRLSSDTQVSDQSSGVAPQANCFVREPIKTRL
jgi:hypothetical protein